MRRIVILLVTFGVYSFTIGQQISYEPSTYEYSFVLNPSMVAMDNQMSFGGVYRKQWFGFEGSPQHMGGFAQYPFMYNSFSLGGYILQDKDGPLSSLSLGGAASYHLPSLFIQKDRLSMGLGVRYNSTKVDFGQLEARDQIAFLNKYDNKTANSTEIDFGAYYVTNRHRGYLKRFFGGLAINNMQSLFVSKRKTNNLYDPAPHINLMFGYKHKSRVYSYTYSGYAFYLKPIIWMEYSVYSPFRFLVGADVGFWDLLYGGLYYSNDATIHMKLGVNLMHDRLKDGNLKLQVFPSYNLGGLRKEKGMSLDIGVIYALQYYE